MEDERIVDLYLAREESAISCTAEKYGYRLRSIANRLLGDEQLAEECENDTYFQTWNLIPPHEPRTYFFPFLGRIIRHLSLDECRKNHRQKRYAMYCELTQEMQECLPGTETTESQAEANMLAGQINRFLEKYSREQQNIFVKRYWYFESIEEIAEGYGIRQSKVKTTLFRMRNDLKVFLEKGGYHL